MQGSLGLLPHLCGLRCVFLTGPCGPSCLDQPVYTSVCLSLELSVNLGLVSLLRACLDLPFCPSVCSGSSVPSPRGLWHTALAGPDPTDMSTPSSMDWGPRNPCPAPPSQAP